MIYAPSLRSTSLDRAQPKVSVVSPQRICGGDTKATAKNWVVLFVRTGSVDKLVRELTDPLTDAGFFPFIPSVEIPFRKSGITRKIRKPLFPGYIFLQTDIEPDLIAKRLEKTVKNTEHVYSILHYGGNEKDVVIREEERLYWERLFDENFCVLGSIGFITDGVLRVTSGALVGLEDHVKKIDRHHRKACVEMEMLGEKRNVKLMLEVVEKK